MGDGRGDGIGQRRRLVKEDKTSCLNYESSQNFYVSLVRVYLSVSRFVGPSGTPLPLRAVRRQRDMQPCLDHYHPERD